MSAREWKPGDLALVKWTDSGSESVAIVESARADEEVLSVWTYTGDVRGPLAFNKRDLRPLVVIDAESREQVERLAIAYTLRHNYNGTPWQDREQHNRDFVIDSLAAALADFANPIVKPDEPTGLGAVVEDADGVRWYLLAPHIADRRWACWDEQYGDRDYDEINAVRILSAGVES